MTSVARLCAYYGRLLGLAVISAALCSTFVAAQDETDRQNALEHFDQWTSIVRSSMNSNPDAVREFLGYGLSRDLGDDPRVLDLCEEVILRSTNAVSVADAVGSVGNIEAWYTPIYSVHRRERIGAVLLEAMRRPQWTIKLDAAGILDDMGGSYRKKAHEFYVGILRTPPDDKTFDQMDRRWPGSTKGLLVEVIRRLVNHWDPGDAKLVHDVTDRYGLLDYWEGEVKKIDRPAWRETEEKFLAKWRSIIGAK